MSDPIVDDMADIISERLFSEGFTVTLVCLGRDWSCSIYTTKLNKIPRVFKAASRLEAIEQCELLLRELLADPQWKSRG